MSPVTKRMRQKTKYFSQITKYFRFHLHRRRQITFGRLGIIKKNQSMKAMPNLTFNHVFFMPYASLCILWYLWTCFSCYILVCNAHVILCHMFSCHVLNLVSFVNALCSQIVFNKIIWNLFHSIVVDLINGLSYPFVNFI